MEVNAEQKKLQVITAEIKRKGDFEQLKKQVSDLGGTTFRLSSPAPLIVPPTISSKALGSEPISALQGKNLVFPQKTSVDLNIPKVSEAAKPKSIFPMGKRTPIETSNGKGLSF